MAKDELTEVRKRLILALAASRMVVSRAAKAVGIDNSTARYHFKMIKSITGKDPKKFYDLVELVDIVRPKKQVHAEWIDGYIGREKYHYTLECSSCGFYFKTTCEHEYQLQDYKKDFEHCPCCLAVMDGGMVDA